MHIENKGTRGLPCLDILLASYYWHDTTCASINASYNSRITSPYQRPSSYKNRYHWCLYETKNIRVQLHDLGLGPSEPGYIDSD